ASFSTQCGVPQRPAQRCPGVRPIRAGTCTPSPGLGTCRSEEHMSELQSRSDLVCCLLFEKNNNSTLRNRYPYAQYSSYCDFCLFVNFLHSHIFLQFFLFFVIFFFQ